MTELRIHYCPETPNMRELKFVVNGKVELSVFCDYIQMVMMKETLEKTIKNLDLFKE